MSVQVYIYIIYGIQNSITNTWNNEVRKKRGRVINGCYPCNYQYMWSATIKIDTAINCSYISDQLATWDVGKWLSDQLYIKTLIYRFCSFEKRCHRINNHCQQLVQPSSHGQKNTYIANIFHLYRLILWLLLYMLESVCSVLFLSSITNIDTLLMFMDFILVVYYYVFIKT